ncbi:MAG TPA: hypothetical protein PKE04_17140 [Clostridia bacterium]|nr:hypothetical protein [Clostridia bacterium]
MADTILLSPPVLFAIYLLLSLSTMYALARYEQKGDGDAHTLDPYACGQRDYTSYVNPNYTQFFRYAFVFSVMHVLALVVTTSSGELLLPLAYVGAGMLTLLIVFRE